MTYRDRPIMCPLCRQELARDGARERWRCGRCRGLFVGLTDLAQELVDIAPSLRPVGRIDGITTPARHADPDEAPRACAICGATMTAVLLGGIPIERCTADDHLWFDAGEIDGLLSRATELEAEHTSVIRRILSVLRW